MSFDLFTSDFLFISISLTQKVFTRRAAANQSPPRWCWQWEELNSRHLSWNTTNLAACILVILWQHHYLQDRFFLQDSPCCSRVLNGFRPRQPQTCSVGSTPDYLADHRMMHLISDKGSQFWVGRHLRVNVSSFQKVDFTIGGYREYIRMLAKQFNRGLTIGARLFLTVDLYLVDVPQFFSHWHTMWEYFPCNAKQIIILFRKAAISFKLLHSFYELAYHFALVKTQLSYYLLRDKFVCLFVFCSPYMCVFIVGSNLWYNNTIVSCVIPVKVHLAEGRRWSNELNVTKKGRKFESQIRWSLWW